MVVTEYLEYFCITPSVQLSSCSQVILAAADHMVVLVGDGNIHYGEFYAKLSKAQFMSRVEGSVNPKPSKLSLFLLYAI